MTTTYCPNVSRDEHDDGDGAEPCVAYNKADMQGYRASRKVLECRGDHAQRDRPRQRIEDPHLPPNVLHCPAANPNPQTRNNSATV